MGIMDKAIPKTVFPRQTPSSLPPVQLPSSFRPLRHSGESRNPEDTFPLGPGFRRGDERGPGRREGRRKPVPALWIPAFMGMTTGWDLQVCNSRFNSGNKISTISDVVFLLA